MTDQVGYSRKFEGAMKSLRLDLDVLKVRMSEEGNRSGDVAELIYQLQEKLDAFEKRLGDLSGANSQFWPKLKVLTDCAFEDLRDSISMAKNYSIH